MRILVDTSVWVQHYRRAVPELYAMLVADQVATHAVVIGELAVGGLRNRAQTLSDLQKLPRMTELLAEDALDFLEQHQLYNLGIGWDDVQLLAAAVLNGIPLWTLDTRLRQQAIAFGVDGTP